MAKCRKVARMSALRANERLNHPLRSYALPHGQPRPDFKTLPPTLPKPVRDHPESLWPALYF
eukprot:6204761-Pleurochrysis_carterae.AAC.2